MSLAKLTPTALLLFVFIVFSGCSDDEVDPDTENPVITLVSPADVSESLHGVVTIKAEVTDNGTIAQVDVLVDATLLTSVSTSPVEISWDTKTVTDGSHVIKIVATDGEGNSTEKTLSVEVKNALFTFAIASDYVFDSTEPWIYVSDADGKTVGMAPMKNGETLTINYPDNHTADSKYSFTRFEYSHITGFTSYIIFSYIDMEPGAYSLKEDNVIRNSNLGLHSLRINNAENTVEVFPGVFGFDVQPEHFFFDGSGFGIDIRSYLRRSPAQPVYYLFYGEEGDALYYQVESAAQGTLDEIDVTDMNLMNTQVIEYDNATSLSVFMQVIETAGDYRNPTTMYTLNASSNPNRLLIKYPDIDFPEYITTITAQNDNGRNTYTKVGDVPTAFKAIEASVESFSNTNNTLSLKSTGSFDYLSFNASKTETIGADSYSFHFDVIVDAASEVSVKIPEIPAELLKYPNLATHTFEFNTASFDDLSGVESLQDFVNTRHRRNENLYVGSKERMYQVINLDGSGGRKGTPTKQYVDAHIVPQADSDTLWKRR